MSETIKKIIAHPERYESYLQYLEKMTGIVRDDSIIDFLFEVYDTTYKKLVDEIDKIRYLKDVKKNKDLIYNMLSFMSYDTIIDCGYELPIEDQSDQ